jgi:DNA repair exonuclease SbcCD nuclease subunit
MITTIIQIGDVHIRNLRRSEEYKEQLDKFLTDCERIVNENGVEQTRVVVCGDILHNKTDISPEGYALAAWFLGRLDEICTTIVFAGNHDINTGNANNRLDPLSVIFSMSQFSRVYYMDKELGYTSGIVEDENIVWCLYSIFDKFAKPLGLAEAYNNPDNKGKTFVGLFHGEVKSAKSDTGYVFENGLDASYFENVDFALLGHVHKRQCIKYNGIQLVYCGSLIQQDYGENISCHGYLVWDVENRTYTPVDIANETNGFYTVTIDSEADIDEDKEEFINL